MCKLKSAIILKDRIFIPDYDSHSDMLTELGITDDYLGASKKFVRAELSPTDGDVFSDIDGWYFNVDQDITPEWFTEEEYKPKMVEAVKKWAEAHIHIGIDGLTITTGTDHYIKDCKNVEVYGDATVNEVYGNAAVKLVYGNATVNEVCGNATVNEVRGNATVTSSEYTKWNNADSLILSDNSTFKDNYGKVIYQSGDYRLISVESGKAIGGE